MLKIHLLQSVE